MTPCSFQTEQCTWGHHMRFIFCSGHMFQAPTQVGLQPARAPTLALVADHSGVEGALAGVGGATELTRGILGAGDAVASVGAWKAHRHIGTQA